MSVDLLLDQFDRLVDSADAVARLRRFVLDLAVRGKLTRRSPSDDHAIQLLSEINHRARERERIGRRRSITLTPIDPDEQPFALPANWIWTRVRQVTRDRGQTIPSSTFTYIDVTAIDKDAGRIRNPTILTAEEAPSRARKLISRGDVLYSCVRPYLLNIAVVDVEIDPPPIASTAFAVLDGFGLIEPRYLWTVLRSPYFVQCVEERMRGQAYPAINDSDFSILPIPLPPLPEQRRIVAKVDEAMALCDQLKTVQDEREDRRDTLRAVSLRRFVALKDNKPAMPNDIKFFLDRSERLLLKPDHVTGVRQTILELAVQGRFTANESHLPWTRTTLGKIGRWGSGGTPNKSHPEYYGGDIPWVVIGDLNESWVTETSSTLTEIGLRNSSARLIPPGTIMIAMYGASVGKLGISGMECATNQAIAHCILDSAFVDRGYLWTVLRSIRGALVASGRGGAQPNISQVILKAWPLDLPSISEQCSIVTKVNELMAVCDDLEETLSYAQTERASLLEALLRETLNGLLVPARGPGDDAAE